jgi:preprotein translocase subunit YajC
MVSGNSIACTTPTSEYDLTISSTAGGNVTEPVEGTHTYDKGTEVTLVATPDSGYRFVEWTGDVDTIADVEDATTTIAVNDGYSITANFIKQQYDLTTSSTDGGNVTTPGEGTFPHDEGTVVNLVGTPSAGYRFVNWTGNVGTIANVNAATTTITMNGDYSITANFVAVYDLNISSTTGGSVTTPVEATSTHDKGTVVNLVASPASDYQFIYWTGDVGTIADVGAATTTITMNGDYSITANFVKGCGCGG